jgi:hypothetical protein
VALVPFNDPAEGDRPIEAEFTTEQDDTQPEEVAAGPAYEGPSINFIATLSGVNTSARPITFDIDGAGKIQFETPEGEKAKVMALLALGRVGLDVTIRVLPGYVVVEKPKSRKKAAAKVEPD